MNEKSWPKFAFDGKQTFGKRVGGLLCVRRRVTRDERERIQVCEKLMLSETGSQSKAIYLKPNTSSLRQALGNNGLKYRTYC